MAEASERLNVIADFAENEKPLGHTVWFFAPPRQRRRKNASPACARSLENREKEVRVRGGGRERVRRREAYLERARVAWAAGAEAARCMACFRRGGAGDGRRGRREVRCRSRRRLRDGRRRARRTRILWRTALFSGDVAFATAEDGPRSVRGGRSGEGAHRRSVHASRLAEAYGRPFGYQVLAAREATRKNGRQRAEGTRRCHRSSRRLFLTLKPERWLESRTVGSAGRPKRVSATPRISRRAR